MLLNVLIYGFLLLFGLCRSRKDLSFSRPIWSQEVNGSWECGSGWHEAVLCSNDSDVLKIPRCYCMFYDEKERQTQLGYCLTSCFKQDRNSYISLKRYSVNNASQFNQDMCSKGVASFVTNKEGRFCSNCKKGFGVDSSIQRLYKCFPCNKKHRLINWFKYFASTLLPLTAFFFVLVIMRTSITNSRMNGIIFNMQILLSSTLFELLMNAWLETGSMSSRDRNFAKFFKLLFDFVNLSFFQGYSHPFCLDPNFNSLEIAALNYIVAVFPFLLIAVSYILIKLYDKNVTVLVLAWKPFKFCLNNSSTTPKTSLVETFASFILLSSVKILATSLIVLSYVNVFDEQGNMLKKRYLYIDASIEFFGPRHLPFAFLAIIISFIFVILPFFLQLLYPCMWFQKLLNYLGWNFQVLRIFMDAFQGSYKTRPHDMRFFSGFYIFARILILLLISIIHSFLEECITVIACFVLLGIIMAIVRPYSVSSHNHLDTVTCLMSTFPCIGAVMFNFILIFDHRLKDVAKWILALPLSSVGFYWIVIITWGLFGDSLKILYRKIHSKLQAHGILRSTLTIGTEDYDYDQNPNESSKLLQNI